jgi:hypothetical protein
VDEQNYSICRQTESRTFSYLTDIIAAEVIKNFGQHYQIEQACRPFLWDLHSFDFNLSQTGAAPASVLQRLFCGVNREQGFATIGK